MFSFIKQTHQSLSRQERIFLYWSIGLLILLSSLPLVYVLLFTPADRYYTGYNLMAGGDKSVYFSQIEQAKDGQILFKNLYTSEPQQARFFAPLWLVLGWLGKLTGFSNQLLFQLARIIAGAFFLYLLYLFLCRIFTKVIFRQLAFWLAGLSSGLGIFTLDLKSFFSENLMFNRFATDLWVSESNTFLTLMHSPLFIISQLLLLLVFWWLLERLKPADWLELLILGLLVLLLGFSHPYDLIILDSVFGCWLIGEMIREKKWSGAQALKFLVVVFFSLIPVGYFLWLFKIEPAIGGWAGQNLTLSPRFLNYALGYGLLFLGAVIALPRVFKSQNNYLRFLGYWIVVGWFLLFIPINFQRRLSNGLHMPMSLLGFIGLLMIVNYFKINWPRLAKKSWWTALWLTITVLLLTLTTFYNLSLELILLTNHQPPRFISRSVYQAMYWLKDQVSFNQVILTERVDGNIIPAISARVVYLGHGHQTIDWSGKLSLVEQWFFKGNSGDQAKKAWLKSSGIDYVFFSSRERALGKFSPSEKDYLKQVYNQGGVEVYEVLEY